MTVQMFKSRDVAEILKIDGRAVERVMMTYGLPAKFRVKWGPDTWLPLWTQAQVDKARQERGLTSASER